MFMFSGWLVMSQTFPLWKKKKNTLKFKIKSSQKKMCKNLCFVLATQETNVHSISYHPSPPCDQPAAQRGSSGFIWRMGRNIQKHPLTVMFLFQPVKPATQPEKNIKNS